MKLYNLFIFIIAWVLVSIQSLALGIEISRFTELINMRTYFIHRLRPAVTILESIEKNSTRYAWLWNNQGQDVLSNINDFFPFTDYRICNAIILMKKRQSFSPLLHVWNDFLQYKYLNNEQFLEDFSKLLLAIAKNILMGLVPHKYNFYRYAIMNSCHNALQQSAFYLVPCLDTVIENIIKMFNVPDYDDEESLRTFESEKFMVYHEFDFTQITSFTEALHKRRYFLRRLEIIIDVIIKNSKQAEYWFETFDDKTANYRFLNKIVINHPDIQMCKEQIEFEHSIYPLLELWEDISNFKHIGDDQYVHDFSLLVFVALKNNIIQQASQGNENVTTLMYDLQIFQDKLMTLHGEKLLEILDTLYEQIMVLESIKPQESTSIDWVVTIKNMVYITSICASILSYLFYEME